MTPRHLRHLSNEWTPAARRRSTLARLAGASAALLLSTAAGLARAQAPSGAKPPLDRPATSHDEDTRRDAARAHFERGVKLMGDESWDAALAEFVTSLASHKTKHARENAAVCLQQLQRYDEALSMYEALAGDTELPLDPEQARSVQAAIRELEGLTGFLEIRTSVSGATVVVDGRDRGPTPQTTPLRVSAGTRVVRVLKEGYLPYETRPLVVGRSRVVVAVHLSPAAPSGHLKVVEQSGAVADVLVDGQKVGTTPYEGALSPGSHVVSLRGPATAASEPVAAEIRLQRQTTLSLRLEPLRGAAIITTEPSNATLVLDGVELGPGGWKGRLRPGHHALEVTAVGYYASRRTLLVPEDGIASLLVSLERNDNDPRWAQSRKRPLTLGLSGSLMGLTSLGGDYDGSCGTPSTDCYQHQRPLGTLAMFHAGYEVVPQLSLEIGVGYGWSRSQLARRTKLAGESGLPIPVDITDRVTISGVVTQVGATYRFLRGSVRLSGGLHFGLWVAAHVLDQRFGSTPCGPEHSGNNCSSVAAGTAAAPQMLPMNPTQDEQSRTVPFVEPQLRLELPWSERLRFGAELGVFIGLPGVVRPCDGKTTCEFRQSPNTRLGQPTYEGNYIGFIESPSSTRESMMGPFVWPRAGLFVETAF